MISGHWRRHFLKMLGLSSLQVATGQAQPNGAREGSATRSAGPLSFPSTFLWGTATSAYQIEGAVDHDGRGRSIWDTFVHTPGVMKDHSNADHASDHYHRYEEDVRLLKALGVKAYRFSIAWPRVFPEGTSAPNPNGLDFYNRLVDELLSNGIEPFATLYHWDLPQTLQDRFGGWQSSETSKAFADYAGYVAEHLTDRVRHIFTINECSRFVDLGYGAAIDAPGLALPPAELNQVRHHVALGHGLAVQAIRAHGRAGTKVGPAEDIVTCVPAIDTPANVQAAETATRALNASYLNVMLDGRYTERFLEKAGSDAPKHNTEELKIISSPVDFVGLNIYAPKRYVVAAEDPPGFTVLPFPDSFPHMASDWLKIGPEAIYWAPRLAAKIWNLRSIYISENGTSSADRMIDGKVQDTDRIMYLRNYLTQLQRATADGVPVDGYFLWSLMDNFEWTDGYNKRFGLHHVDFETQARTPKLSAAFYRETIRRNSVV